MSRLRKRADSSAKVLSRAKVCASVINDDARSTRRLIRLPPRLLGWANLKLTVLFEDDVCVPCSLFIALTKAARLVLIFVLLFTDNCDLLTKYQHDSFV